MYRTVDSHDADYFEKRCAENNNCGYVMIEKAIINDPDGEITYCAIFENIVEKTKVPEVYALENDDANCFSDSLKNALAEGYELKSSGQHSHEGYVRWTALLVKE